MIKLSTTKSFILTGASILALSISAGAANAQAAPTKFDIEAQPLQTALLDFNEQSGIIVIASQDLITGKTAPAINGMMEPDDALAIILAGSGLKSTQNNTGAYTITLAKTEVEKAAPKPFRVAQLDQEDTGAVTRVSDRDGIEDERRVEDTIIVTGTSISGVYPNAVPLEVFDAQEIANTGATTIEDFFTRIPQNLSNFTSVAPFSTATGDAGRNGINLRGLGAGATLVLINGRRLVAPGGRSPDVSLIPLGAVARVEVLSDGASAVYGSDAIGGVVNIILRDDAEGAETAISYGTVTNGNHSQVRVDHNVGFNWDSGNLVAGYGFLDQSDLDASDRDFATAATPFSLAGDEQRHSGVLSINQKIHDRVNVSGDILYSSRKFQTLSNQQVFTPPQLRDFSLKQEQFFGSLGAVFDLSSKLKVEVSGTYSNFEENSVTLGDGVFDNERNEDASFFEISSKLQGDIIDLPAGTAKFSTGGGYTEEDFESVTIGNPINSNDRDSYFFFGEAFIPLFGPENRVPGIERLELNIAARYTKYSDFGGETSPRVGLYWSPIEGIGLRGTYSQGFRAPSLRTLSGSGTFAIFSPAAFGFADPFSTDGSTVLLFSQGNNSPNVGPETSESYTAGIDIEPVFAPGLRVSGTYFNISYVDRLAAPDSSGGFGAVLDPASFSSLFTSNPSLDFVTELVTGSTNFLNFSSADITDPASIASVVTVALDNRITNLAASNVDGLDFSVDYRREASFGELNFGASFTYIFDSTLLPALNAPLIETLNTVGNPVDFRGRAFVGLTREKFKGQINLNYFDDYTNTFVTPEIGVDSWTTVDLTMSYDFGAQDVGPLSGLVLSLSATNLFDQDPPFVGLADTFNTALNEPVGFDPANASPVGRFVVFGLKKKW